MKFPELLARVRCGLTPDACWEFDGAHNGEGYGYVRWEGRMVGVHVIMFLAGGGEIPAGYELDHTCRNPGCCNPRHVEPVPSRTNTLRGTGPTAVNAAKTRCANGHEFTPENTRIGKLGRACRTCCREAQQRYAQRRRNEVA